eukprot:CAMPEP_0174360180 /NCGR_PEP_ID=MMETSP0811_2-20130205/52727_1 /TAXON_ID=73025 ORGANISM="Eutreptiella gymnastica-like, Strain CCMP1594" /NCGR_SAMPLE_ID=MMETSP0811_2 /ASSEMBLY_ACC=CAM_ASM_000667 /LENGTH=61 /DNA_ID=CAMNT_0015495629 /DNA_START=54 /DNA_END=239 /DNA_ORIENTATION=+
MTYEGPIPCYMGELGAELEVCALTPQQRERRAKIECAALAGSNQPMGREGQLHLSALNALM